MSSGRVDSESKVSGNQANIPASIRRKLGIDDGDTLRWHLEDDGSLRVRVVQPRSGTFSDSDGYDGEQETDAEREHDAWGVDVEYSSHCKSLPT
ncbi:AbrB/MazE/SpoVT family DNA-binding domain-containing protein [Natrarchaeobius sp. A-rgal3]|uniref:AbrB/MazE/SpoVT family DNA-binding domain-containing protein n=1 Tax=Natrarchaeobius versutus TaxID=1679078 RepID=UPI00350FAD89